MEKQLLEFIADEFVIDPDLGLNADTKLFSTGVIDSFSLVSLQLFIEREFGKRIPAPLITPASFDTVRLMMEVIDRF